MPGSTSSRRRFSPRRNRERRDTSRYEDEERDREERAKSRSNPTRRDSEDVIPYEPRGRDGRPAAPRRRSTYVGDDPEDDDYDRPGRGRNDDKYYPPRASDTRRRGGPPSPKEKQSSRRPRSESQGQSKDKEGSTRARSGSRAGSSHEEKGKTSDDTRRKRNQVIQAALMAGALEAMRQRSQPGDWVGEKGFRVATAAVSAGLVDVGLDKGPNNKNGVGNLIKSTVGGLLIDKVANSGRK